MRVHILGWLLAVTGTGAVSSAPAAPKSGGVDPCRDTAPGVADYRGRLERAYAENCREARVVLGLALVWLRAHLETGEARACEAARLLDTQSTSPLRERLVVDPVVAHALCDAEQFMACVGREEGWDEVEHCTVDVCAVRNRLRDLDGRAIASGDRVIAANETLERLHTFCAHEWLGEVLRHERKARALKAQSDVDSFQRARVWVDKALEALDNYSDTRIRFEPSAQVDDRIRPIRSRLLRLRRLVRDPLNLGRAGGPKPSDQSGPPPMAPPPMVLPSTVSPHTALVGAQERAMGWTSIAASMLVGGVVLMAADYGDGYRGLSRIGGPVLLMAGSASAMVAGFSWGIAEGVGR